MKIKKTLLFYAISVLIVGCSVMSCSEDGGYKGAKETVPSDPNKPIVFADYIPKEGVVRTLVFFEGNN